MPENIMKKEPDFDPSLGMACAETWWKLGKWLAKRNDARALKKWAAETRKELSSTEAAHVTESTLGPFADKVYRLLKRKYEGDAIEVDAAKLTEGNGSYRIKHNGRYTDVIESFKTFWANEYVILLQSMGSPGQVHNDWLKAAALCKECGDFFIKQRKDQVFDTAKCRTKWMNREAYEPKSDRRKHKHHR